MASCGEFHGNIENLTDIDKNIYQFDDIFPPLFNDKVFQKSVVGAVSFVLRSRQCIASQMFTLHSSSKSTQDHHLTVKTQLLFIFSYLADLKLHQVWPEPSLRRTQGGGRGGRTSTPESIRYQ